MPQADLAPSPAALRPEPTRLRGWGGGPGATGWLLRPTQLDSVRAALELARDRAWTGLLARGMGRSYGDAAQLGGGLVVETTRLKGAQLDEDEGSVTASAGVTLAELLAELVPAGWMVPVLPGTQHVSVGGAIAGDIHGKNHGTAGTFGSHVESLGLLTAEGEEVALGPDDELFEATLGGMGLTGVILWARIRLAPVSSPFLSVDTDRVGDLDQALAALRAPGGPYRVAWLDLLGSRPGRGIVTRAEHLPGAAVPRGARGAATVRSRATVPEWWPGALLRPLAVQAFNELRFRQAPVSERGQVEPIGSHMFPLDALAEWPRLYGWQGFVQYQLVVPYGAESALEAVIAELRHAHIPCYLAVLKDFGEAGGPPLSFPIAGWTLTQDVPRAAPGLDAALNRCNEIVAEAGGRVYLSKDVHTRPDALRAMYPRLDEWRAVRDRADPDGVWRSDLGVRTGLVNAERG